MMKLVGHGIDIVEVSRISSLLAMEGDDFELGWFTASERENARQQGDHVLFYAGRCAAKEAVAKALGTGFTGDVSQVDIEIGAHESGAPFVVLSGGALAVARQLGIDRWSLSISHTERHAVASAIALVENG